MSLFSKAYKAFSLGSAGATGLGIFANPVVHATVAAELTALGTVAEVGSAVVFATVGLHALLAAAAIAFCAV